MWDVYGRETAGMGQGPGPGSAGGPPMRQPGQPDVSTNLPQAPIENPLTVPVPGGPQTAPAPGPTPQPDADVNVLPPDAIGDIPPPPIPTPPIVGSGVAGIPGTEAGTFALPGSRAAAPFRTSAYAAARPPRFGPGAPLTGGGGGMGAATGAGGGDVGAGLGLGLAPDDAAEILRNLVHTSSYRAGGAPGGF